VCTSGFWLAIDQKVHEKSRGVMMRKRDNSIKSIRVSNALCQRVTLVEQQRKRLRHLPYGLMGLHFQG
jgi:hypothetical protein